MIRLRTLLLAATALILPFASSLSAQATPDNSQHATSSDVCVYGATPAGVAAAIGAAREGKKTVLLEPMQIIGAMMSSGLSFSDSNQTAREALGGVFEEFYLRVEKHYQSKGIELPYKVADKDQKHWMNEPHVAENIFHDLLKEAGVTVITGQSLKEVTKDGARIRQIRTTDGLHQARVFIDGTYEGDLMAKAGVSYTLGREPAHLYQESLAGHQYPKKPMAVSPVDAQGKILPLITAPTAGDPTQADGHIMVYSFRLCVTDKAENKVPFPKPANYDPAQFELVKRYFQKYPEARQLMDFYKLPNGKIDVNNSIGGQISLGLVGASDAWPEADEATRQKIWQQHKDYTLGLLHFLATDPSVPAKHRDEILALGLCKDEFASTENWPPVLYIREARRMKGAYFMTQADVLQKVDKPDSIAISSFPIDSHDCQRIPTSDGGFVNEGTIFPRHVVGRKIGQPHQVPYRSTTPLEKECDNLLVPVCISCSHVVMSSIRVEPTWIVIGQSTGIAAALAATLDTPVQKVPYDQLRARLLAQKQVLDLSVVKMP